MLRKREETAKKFHFLREARVIVRNYCCGLNTIVIKKYCTVGGIYKKNKKKKIHLAHGPT